ncbi:MAG: CvpA family protein [Desulfobacterales bacterium]|nr:CvpA family protein [Desulfobacterales bacterium]
MNPFDMAIVVILGYCMILGIFKGFIKEVASIIAVIGGFYVAYTGYEMLVPFLALWIETPAYQDIISFILIFLIVCLVINLIGSLLRMLVKLVLLGVVDRFFGVLLGALKGMLIVTLLYVLLITFLPIGGKQMVAESCLAPCVNTVSKAVLRVIPEDKRRAFRYNMEELKKDWSAEPETETQD